MEEITIRNKQTEKKVRRLYGTALRELRQKGMLSMQQAADLLGSTPEHVSEVEDGIKSISSTRLLQTIASLGGTLYITTKDGTSISLDIPPLTEDQKKRRAQEREESLRQNDLKEMPPQDEDEWFRLSAEEKAAHCHEVFDNIGRSLTELRNHYKLTQSEAAAKMGITEKKLAAIERGTIFGNINYLCKRVEAIGGRLAIVPAEEADDPHCQFIEFDND